MWGNFGNLRLAPCCYQVLLIILLTFWIFAIDCDGYKPVFMMHPLTGGALLPMQYLVHKIEEAHPGTIIHNSKAYEYLFSATPLWDQIKGEVGREFLEFSNKHKNGFHFIGFSQGGTVGRGLIENYPEHNVKSFISLAAPLAGIYGLVAAFNMTVGADTGSIMFYNKEAQRTFSVANFWNDPSRQDLHLKYNEFLPYIDNAKTTNMSEKYKQGFTKCSNFSLIGGPDDTFLVPWYSSQFSYADENYKFVDFRDRVMYTQDWFGLRTVDEQNKIHLCTIKGVNHFTWPFRDDVIQKCVLPFLD